jgi:uncharacterized protein YeaO (DUF488 family)
MIRVRRVYDPAEADDGARYLVDRLWPRGVRKEEAELDGWLKDVAPSHDLRKRFHGHPEKWEAFVTAYHEELDAGSEGLDTLREAARRGTVTLLYASRDPEHNNALALKAYLEKHAGAR